MRSSRRRRLRKRKLAGFEVIYFGEAIVSHADAEEGFVGESAPFKGSC